MRISFGYFAKAFSIVSRRRLFLVVLSWLFFGFLVFGALMPNLSFVEIFPLPLDEPLHLGASNAFALFLWIFLFNLGLSGFLLLTASGVLFFAVPVFFLLLRGFLWGAFLTELSMPLFLWIFPTLILEGTAYVLAAVAGVGLGLSWLWPRWMFKGESLSRREAFMRGVRESAFIYLLVVLFLFVAAAVETVTIVFMV